MCWEVTPESGGHNRPALAIDVSLTSLAAAIIKTPRTSETSLRYRFWASLTSLRRVSDMDRGSGNIHGLVLMSYPGVTGYRVDKLAN